MGVVNQAVQDGVGQGGIADHLVPVAHGQLAGHQRGAPLVAVLQDLQQIVALGLAQGLGAQIVQDDQIGTREAGQQLQVAPIAAGDGQLAPQARQAQVEYAVAFAAGLVA